MMGFFQRRSASTEPYRFAVLARYNSEKDRGLVHTAEWKAKMVEEQRRFDEEIVLRTGGRDDRRGF
jgi:hypothetical protein